MSLAVFNRIALAEIYEVTNQTRETIQSFGELRFAFLMITVGSFSLALLSSLLDILILKKLIRSLSLGFALIIGFIAQAAMVLFLVAILLDFYILVTSWISNDPLRAPKPLDLIFILVYQSLAIALSKLLIEIDRKMGPGNLWKMISGRFFKPREEERIFMFIDLKGATTIAEHIGHMAYSKLLRDCFHDFSIVDQYNAHIYQYVGDEVVVSWTPKDGFKNDNFIKAFFAFSHILKSKSDYYQELYGVRPYFKAGANIGPVIITEVGDIKREITYHGDTLNTAARIQDRCNDLDAQMLIPETLYHLVKHTREYQIEDVGCISLKGKEKEVRLYRITQTGEG